MTLPLSLTALQVAYIEIYMERIRDLLDPFRTKVNLSVREDPRHGVYVAGVTEEYCTCERELLQIMTTGAANRATAATGMNEGSSRSHSVFMVTVTQRHMETNSQKTGKLFLVDLAGSEMVRKTNATGQQLEEAKTINKSLSALGLVINALAEDKGAHVPYRDSKLTRVLQDSLGGNAKTALLINCSPSSYNANETLSTLRFGSRAKTITNKPKINEQRSVEELSQLLQKAENAIDMQQSYILALEGQLRVGGGGDGSGEGSASGEAAVALQGKVAALSAELSEEREETSRAMKQVEALTSLLKEKERLLVAGSELLQEAQRHMEGQRAAGEQLEANVGKTLDEGRSAFEAEELRVHVETLQKANEKLMAELEAKEAEEDAASSTAESSSPGPAVAAGAGGLVPLSEARLAALASELGLSPDAVAFVKMREAEWAGAGGGRGGEGEGDHKARLSAELQAAAEKNMELEMQLSALKATVGPEAEKQFSIKERNHMRMQKKFESMQQRLEQLVAVHRQLLRKYGALELDIQEDKKKIALRDERISQLEANTRTLAMNMRTQAARHVVELTKLREQISSVRQEQFEARIAGPEGSSGGHVLRGGAGVAAPQPVRAIRGGGAR